MEEIKILRICTRHEVIAEEVRMLRNSHMTIQFCHLPVYNGRARGNWNYQRKQNASNFLYLHYGLRQWASSCASVVLRSWSTLVHNSSFPSYNCGKLKFNHGSVMQVGFIRDDPSLNRMYPAELSCCTCWFQLWSMLYNGEPTNIDSTIC